MQMVYALMWDDSGGIPYSSVQFIKKRILFTFTWQRRQKFAIKENTYKRTVLKYDVLHLNQ